MIALFKTEKDISYTSIIYFYSLIVKTILILINKPIFDYFWRNMEGESYQIPTELDGKSGKRKKSQVGEAIVNRSTTETENEGI